MTAVVHQRCVRCGINLAKDPWGELCRGCLGEAFPGGAPGSNRVLTKVSKDDALAAGLSAPGSNDLRDQRPCAVDVSDLAREDNETEPMVVEHLIPPQTVLALTGEEGEGKTTIADQLMRQVMRAESALGMFPLGELAPTCALFVDTEQEEFEARRRGAEMDRRGLEVEPGRMYWLWAGGLNLAASTEDQAYLEAEIARVGADLVWIDAGSNALEDPKDDGNVRAFFNYLSALMRRCELRAEGLTLHPRKRAQGEYGRRFDDTFGSREWKGRTSKALYIDGSTIVAWKDRGGSLRRVWPGRAGGRYPKATLLRPGLDNESAVPFLVDASEPEAADVQALEEQALGLVTFQPETFAKTALARALGGRYQDALGVVERLLAEGRLGPNEARAKLSVPEGASDGNTDA